MTVKELQQIIIDNFYNRESNEIEIPHMDFGNKNINISRITARSIDQRGHDAQWITQQGHYAEVIHQGDHTALRIYQNSHNAEVIVQDNHYADQIIR